jgi:hypothetical protein
MRRRNDQGNASQRNPGAERFKRILFLGRGQQRQVATAAFSAVVFVDMDEIPRTRPLFSTRIPLPLPRTLPMLAALPRS